MQLAKLLRKTTSALSDKHDVSFLLNKIFFSCVRGLPPPPPTASDGLKNPPTSLLSASPAKEKFHHHQAKRITILPPPHTHTTHTVKGPVPQELTFLFKIETYNRISSYDKIP